MMASARELIFDSEDTKKIYEEIMRTYERDRLLYNIPYQPTLLEEDYITRDSIQTLIQNYNSNFSNITRVVFVPLYNVPML